jgi:(p)ppGpp synthase/HD superfamily hydrolase
LGQAAQLAARLHAKQTRRVTGENFLGHLLRVAGLVLYLGGSEDEVLAALLHDAVEDQGGMATFEEIKKVLGEQVAMLVLAVSDATTSPKPPWAERKEAFLERLKSSDMSVRRVVLADKIDNLQDLLLTWEETRENIWGKFHGGKQGTCWYFSEILTILESTTGDSFFERGVRLYRRLVKNLQTVVRDEAGSADSSSGKSIGPSEKG